MFKQGISSTLFYAIKSNGIATHRKYDQGRVEGAGQNRDMVRQSHPHRPGQRIQDSKQRHYRFTTTGQNLQIVAS